VDDTMPPDDYEDAEVEEEPAPRITKQQLAAIKAATRNNGWDEESYAVVLAGYQVNSAEELSRDQALDFVRALMLGPGEQEELGV